jgi:hypothetical protein
MAEGTHSLTNRSRWVDPVTSGRNERFSRRQSEKSGEFKRGTDLSRGSRT